MVSGDYLEAVRRLPDPTDAQIDRFVEYLVSAHSWYKHLPLVGADFVIYLRAELGGKFPLRHPKLPFGNDSPSYHRAFSHLAYMWRLPGEGWQEDFFDKTGRPPSQFVSEQVFKLYPYCHPDFAESIRHHGITPGVDLSWHPNAEALTGLAEAHDEGRRIWTFSMTKDDREWAVSSGGDEDLALLSQARRQFIDAETRKDGILRDLEAAEIARIHRAVEQLMDLLSES